jgi:hypothetical protein
LLEERERLIITERQFSQQNPFVAEAVKLLQTIPGVHLIRRLERLGLKVTVESLEGAA